MSINEKNIVSCVNNIQNVCVNFPTSGVLPLRMTNDLLFHYLMQDKEHPNILKGIISSFFEIPFEDIQSVVVENPISYGDDVTSKEMILDVKTYLNNNQYINLEMQVANYHNWPERSLSYMCRCFDNLTSGQGYDHVKGAYHIGFLDFTLFPEVSQFYSVYDIRERTTNHLYTSKFGISVVDLNLINEANDADKKYHRDIWARFFKATTWEEVAMLAQQDVNVKEAAEHLSRLTEDKKLRDQYWAREDYNRCQIDRDNYYNREIQARDTIIAAMKVNLENTVTALADKDAEITSKNAALADKDAEIAELKKLLQQKR